MTPDFLHSIEQISRASLELTPQDRAGYIAEACNGNDELKTAVESRVDQYNRARLYFDQLSERLGLDGLADPGFSVMEGQTFGKYRIEHMIGRGGMGIVYRAVDTSAHKPVALKFLLPRFADDERAQLRFAREAIIMESMYHENLPVVHEVLEYNGLAVIVMEFIEGRSLKGVLKSGPLPVDTVIDYAVQIAGGLEEAHNAGIVHRDLKPANIMITDEGIVKILDFGLAKLHEASSLTRTGSTLGTVAYMSPEQARGENVDHRTDIWSLGVVLYEMLSGELPFKGVHDQAVIYSILNNEPDLAENLAGDPPEYLLRVIRQALAKNVDRRIQHAHQLRTALLQPEQAFPTSGQGKILLRPIVYVLSLMALAFLVFLWIRNSRESLYHITVDSLAILPFQGDGADTEALAGGLSVVLANQLGALDSIKVIAPSSALRFEGRTTSPSEVGELLGVSGYIQGQLRSGNDSLHLLMDLIDVNTGAVLWQDSISDLDEHFFALQSRSLQAIAGALGVPSSLLERQHAQPHVESAAFHAYVESNYFFAVSQLYLIGGFSFLQKADSSLSRAIALDSSFADALGLMAELQLTLSLAEGRLRPDVSGYVERALSLDPNNQYGLLASGKHVWFSAWDWEKAEEIFQHALTMYPQDARIYQTLGDLYLSSNADSLGSLVFEKAVELDPIDKVSIYWMLTTLNKLGKYSEAIAVGEKLLAFDSTDAITAAYTGKSAYLNGQDSLAVAYFDKYRAYTGDVGVLMSVNYRDMGYHDIFEDKYQKVIENQIPGEMHFMYFCLRDSMKTIYWLEKDLEQHPLNYKILLNWDYETLLKDEPRFRALLRRANMEPFLYRRGMTAAFDVVGG